MEEETGIVAWVKENKFYVIAGVVALVLLMAFAG